jgi:fructokinase
MQLGSIEAGGTKFVCAVGNEDYQVQDRIKILTTTPEETLQKVVMFFKKHCINALSVSSFGPIEIRRNSSKYGYITKTPKKYWTDTDFVGFLKKFFDVPIFWTTDVNGSAYGEYRMATLANERINSLVYYTIGTGVGAGIVIDGNLVGSTGHPEMGHVLLKRHPNDENFNGICPFHGDCLEGLVSGPTFNARLGLNGVEVPQDNDVWDIMAYYVAQAVVQTTLTIRPDKIIFGGGVTSEFLLRKVRIEFEKMLNGYIEVPELNEYITTPTIIDNGSATLGNFAFAEKILAE